MNKLKTYGLDRLKHRLSRLQNLVELEAPSVIVAHEICMVVDAMKMYSSEAWYKALEDAEMRRLKFANGFCSHEGCGERRNHDADIEVSDLCPKHIAEFEANVEEYTNSDCDIDDEDLQ